MEYLVPAQRTTTELKVANSRFITTIASAFSVDEARAFIKEINKAHSDAAHNVPVYQIGFGSSLIAHSSDDGEPPGTAGRPALAVLQGSGLGDAVMVITRYFGGTKLGTGGLVKAYGSAARSAVTSVPKAKKITVSECIITIDYQDYDHFSRLLRETGAAVTSENFTDRVKVGFSIEEKYLPAFEQRITDVFRGRVAIKITIEGRTALVPVKG